MVQCISFKLSMIVHFIEKNNKKNTKICSLVSFAGFIVPTVFLYWVFPLDSTLEVLIYNKNSYKFCVYKCFYLFRILFYLCMLLLPTLGSKYFLFKWNTLYILFLYCISYQILYSFYTISLYISLMVPLLRRLQDKNYYYINPVMHRHLSCL